MHNYNRGVFRRALVGGLAASFALATLTLGAGAVDTATAEKLLINGRDVGADYSETKTAVSPDAFGKLAACVGQPVTDRSVVTDLQGSEFGNRTTGAVVFSSVQIVATAAMAKADRRVLADAKFPNCVAQLLSSSQAAAAHLTGIDARRATVKHFGDFSTAVLIQGTGTLASGAPITITQIEVGIMKGRAEVSAGFTTRGQQPFDRRTAEAILAKVSRRLARAHV